jgi:hypothetical protein
MSYQAHYPNADPNQPGLVLPVTEPAAGLLRQPSHWWMQYQNRQSRYEGWFLIDPAIQPNRMFKVIERIEILNPDNTPMVPTAITVLPQSVQWHFPDDLQVRIALTDDTETGLSIHANRSCLIQITLDTREIYANPVDERRYVSSVNQGTLLCYSDPLLGNRDLYLHIRDTSTQTHQVITHAIQKTESWTARSYPWDATRNSEPSTKWTLQLPAIAREQLSLGVGWDAHAALYSSAQAAHAGSAQQESPENSAAINETAAQVSFSDSHYAIAQQHARHALDQLITADGCYAGLPWFHQLWTRDELLAGLGMRDDQKLALIEKYAAMTPIDGELPTFIGSGTTCADGLGLLAVLIREYGIDRLPAPTREKITLLLRTGLEQLWLIHRTPSDLIYSGYNRTWMDTIGRSGFRIEIQALTIAALRLLGDMEPENPTHYQRAEAIRNAVRHTLALDTHLADGLDESLNLDPTKRPNVFIAYLADPELLLHHEWQTCFETILEATTLAWGGLSSIDLSDARYQSVSAGEANTSYHNGDSWYLINNLAAGVLLRHNPEHYAPTISQLLDASVRDILQKGFLGHHSEIAEAASGQAWGCGTQAFSTGPFLWALDQR